jgi:hypothetical protein
VVAAAAGGAAETHLPSWIEWDGLHSQGQHPTGDQDYTPLPFYWLLGDHETLHFHLVEEYGFGGTAAAGEVAAESLGGVDVDAEGFAAEAPVLVVRQDGGFP